MPGEPGGRRGEDARGGDEAGQGPGLPHRRLDRWRAGDHTTPTPPAAARSGCAASWKSRRTHRGRTSLVITELPYQVNHDNFITSIAEQVRDGKIAGIANIEDEGSDRVGMRIVVELKRDAVAKVVLNNLYKHTQLQTSFGANMLAIVDGVPRTLRLDQMIRLLRRPPARRHHPAHHATGCARPRSAPTSCAAWSRRWTLSTR